jgi:hypothetical protein
MGTLEQEQSLVAAGRGKWSQAGVPHRGWQCVDIEDLGEPQVECEMCESQTIRYVHHMEHPVYPDALEVGCICAGHMEGDVAAARTREASMKSRAGKRKRWLTRKWRISAKGNPWLRAGGYRITVYERSGGWAATVSAEDNSLVQHSRRNYKIQNQAKLAAFDHITRLEAGNA